MNAREKAFDEAVRRCYHMDGDYYFAPPEDRVEVAFDCLLDAVVEALRERGEVACGGFEKEAAEFLLQEFRDGNAA